LLLYEPSDRGESTLSQIGANDSSMVSPSQKRAQQAKYAFELAEANAKSQHVRDQSRVNGDGGHGVKPRRRLSAEVSIEDSNIISSIGQDDQQLKERRKMLQLEYAQQLSNQQNQRHQQNPSPISSPTKVVSNGSPYGSRGNTRDNYYGENSNSGSKSGLVNFGSDPEVEAEKKRVLKAAYGRQLNDQQSRANDLRSRSGESDRSDARNDGYRTSSQNASYDSREDDRNAAVSAAELKRQQQKQYHDEITSAAAAAPIHNPRTSLKNNTQSRQSNDNNNGYNSNSSGTDMT
jgi:hypothetical protein